MYFNERGVAHLDGPVDHRVLQLDGGGAPRDLFTASALRFY